MPEERRGIGPFVILGGLLLVGSLAAGFWWSNRPDSGKSAPTLNPDELDVICTGRIDAAGMVIPLEPATAGRITKIVDGIGEGATVRKGDELLWINDDAAKLRLVQAEAAVNAAQVEVDAATSDVERFPNQIAAKGLLLDAAAARLEAARKLLEQRREQQSFVPLGRAEQEAMEAQIRELTILESAERANLADLKKLNPELKLRAAKAKLAAADADRRLAEIAVSECVLRAPADGTILRMQVAVGGMVAPGTPFPPVVFAPSGPLLMRAEIDQEYLGRVQPGMKAIIQDENHPDGQTWSGHVRSVAGWVAMRRTMILDPGELNDVRTAECVIDFDTPPTDVWIGQRMRARIIREKAAK